MPFFVWKSPRLTGLALFGLLLLGGSSTAVAAVAADAPSSKEMPSVEQQAVLKLRRFTTNMQFNKDGTVRLVRFSKSAVTDAMLDHLRHFTKLDYLALVCPQVTDDGLRSLDGLTNLDTLLLSGSGITDKGLAHLAHLDKLQRLYLDDTKLTDAGLELLAGLKSLNALSLRGTQVSDNGLASLGQLPNLEFLMLADTRVTGSGLKHLRACSKLRSVYFTRCPIHGSELAALQGMDQLEVLGLTETPIGDESVELLGQFSQLKHLELLRTRITQAKVGQLRETLRTTHVIAHVAPQIDSNPSAGNLDSSHASDTESGAEADGEKPGATAQVTAEATTKARVKATLPPIPERLGSSDETPDFQRHVIPLLGRLGCNGRACHGSFQGQGGFRLSMFGYDFDLDLENLHERIDVDSPGDSLIISKPTSEDDHGGGVRFASGGWRQALLQRWIAGGAGGTAKDPPRFVRLEVTPREVVFAREGETTQLQAIAVWSDGTREDVTCLTRFQSNDETIAEVSPDGLIRARGKGDTYVISFYDNGIFSTQVLRPFNDATGDRYEAVEPGTSLDRPVLAKLRKLGIRPSVLCDDGEFLRRVSLDMIGTLPTPEEIATFVGDNGPDKRTRKIDQLLERPAYTTWWTTRLCDLTGSNAGYLGGTEMAQPVAAQWRAWIERRVRDNVGWDNIVEGIVLATSRRPGQTYADFVEEQSEYTRRADPTDYAAPENQMPHFWFRSNITLPKDKALAFGYAFLGVRLECAQCHKHPYDQWSKRDFELFTAFFTRIKAGVAPDAAELHERMRNMLGVPVKLNTAALRRQSYLRIAAEGRAIPWKEIFVATPGKKRQPAKLLGGSEIDLNAYDDPRTPLMQWLLNEPNRTFAKAFVNRIWASYFHVGIIEPPDDLNLANPPSNKELLDYLVDGFVKQGYDMKWLHRTIANSHTYQRSWRTNETNRTDHRNFSRAVVRRLPAEVAIDAVFQATASDAKLAQAAIDTAGRKIGQHPKSFQARSIDFSLLVFGKPLRTTNCDCERRSEPTLLQALYLRNDKEVLDALERNDGWLAQLHREHLAAKKNDAKKATAKKVTAKNGGAKNGGETTDDKRVDDGKIDDLIRAAYLRTLSRRPTKQEMADCREHLRDESDETSDWAGGLQDILWALLNTQEFITNH